MTELLRYMVLSALVWLSCPAGAGLRTRRDVHCREDLEYRHDGVCCSNCPAGTRMISPCTAAFQKGHCEECEDGTFMEHTNHLTQCFKCTPCRRDQEVVRACTHTQDTECQCRPGRFCAPDQACETCKRCLKCKSDEVTVRNCTPTTNTECKTIQPKPESASGKAVLIVLFSIFAVAVIGLVVFCMWRSRRVRDSRRRASGGQKPGQDYGDNDPAEELQRPSSSGLILSRPLMDEEFPKLVPVNGEDSLRKSFEYFEELDIDYHKKFFRHLGIADNTIKSKEHLPYEDRIHELLNIWLEKEGKDASLNDLLKAMLDLNQRRTAENIMDKAIHEDHYICKEAI